jgi:hypothetical protein
MAIVVCDTPPIAPAGGEAVAEKPDPGLVASKVAELGALVDQARRDEQEGR